MAHALYRNWTALNMPRNIPDSSGSNDLSHFLQRTFMRVACTVVRTDTGPSANFEMNYDFHQGCCCCLPTPMTLASGGGGESDVPACGPPASFSVHLASSAVTPAGSVHKSSGDNVVRLWVQLKR